MEPDDPIVTETHWKRQRVADVTMCPSVAADRQRWRIHLPADWVRRDEGLRTWIERTLGRTCESDCTMTVDVRLTISAVEWPNFFDGSGSFAGQVELMTQSQRCRDRRVFSVMIQVDQGRRGTRERQAQELGRLIGSSLRRHASAPLGNVDRP